LSGTNLGNVPKELGDKGKKKKTFNHGLNWKKKTNRVPRPLEVCRRKTIEIDQNWESRGGEVGYKNVWITRWTRLINRGEKTGSPENDAFEENQRRAWIPGAPRERKGRRKFGGGGQGWGGEKKKKKGDWKTRCQNLYRKSIWRVHGKKGPFSQACKLKKGVPEGKKVPVTNNVKGPLNCKGKEL